jgi:hypothetical protein
MNGANVIVTDGVHVVGGEGTGGAEALDEQAAVTHVTAQSTIATLTPIFGAQL